jgi:hypothetical protein
MSGVADSAARERICLDTVISLPNVLVVGQLHVKSATDAQGYLMLEARSFIPVTAATIYDHSDSNTRLESPVVLVKKDAISSMSLTPH